MKDGRVGAEWDSGAEWGTVPMSGGDGMREAGQGRIWDGGAGNGVAWDRLQRGGGAGGVNRERG